MLTMDIIPNPGAALGQLDEKTMWPSHPRDIHIPNWDTGVFINKMAKLSILPKKLDNISQDERVGFQQNPEILLVKAQNQAPDSLSEGTWHGTQLALVKIYELIEKRYSSYMDTVNFEPTVPSPLTMQEKRQFFAFTDKSDNYPPHLNLAGNKPAAKQDETVAAGFALAYFDTSKFHNSVDTSKSHSTGAKIISDVSLGPVGTPDAGVKLQDVENYNRKRREGRKWKDIFDLPNVGDLEDWYTDARFAQQHFTGTNPTTIELASEQWIKHFTEAPKDLADQKAQETIKTLASISRESLYMQDYSYFREAVGMYKSAVIKCEFDEIYKEGGKTKSRKRYRYGCASVCLFYLNDAGTLQPLAIVIDWRGSADKSVTIYNRELFKRDAHLLSFYAEDDSDKKKPEIVDEGHDWAWRYAKTCIQCSDWLRHECTVHLTNTHLVEESVIVAANRQLPSDHLVFRLLYPHWQKTLSLNAAARATLVPQVIVKLIGFEDNQAFKFIQHAYENFDFKAQYVPTDLRRRGFAPEHLHDRKFHNYAYARCIHSMWYKIRNYVAEMLSLRYKGPNADTQVKEDKDLQKWSEDVRKSAQDGGANLSSFPTISTVNELVDCVTMCIHIASPQHTAVNYLQNFYQSFVVNKPACLYTPPPTSLTRLLGYTESDLVTALPMNHPQEWLLASHIPYLLSFKPGDKESLIMYAASKYHVYKFKRGDEEQATAAAAARFYKALADSEYEFKKYAMETDDSGEIAYEVLSPAWNAVSILI